MPTSSLVDDEPDDSVSERQSRSQRQAPPLDYEEETFEPRAKKRPQQELPEADEYEDDCPPPSRTPKIRFCPECGEEVYEGEKVCVECGTRLNERGNQQQRTQNNQRGYTTQRQAEPVVKKQKELYCPQCNEPIAPDDGVCLECGYWLKRPASSGKNNRNNQANRNQARNNQANRNQARNNQVVSMKISDVKKQAKELLFLSGNSILNSTFTTFLLIRLAVLLISVTLSLIPYVGPLMYTLLFMPMLQMASAGICLKLYNGEQINFNNVFDHNKKIQESLILNLLCLISNAIVVVPIGLFCFFICFFVQAYPDGTFINLMFMTVVFGVVLQTSFACFILVDTEEGEVTGVEAFKKSNDLLKGIDGLKFIGLFIGLQLSFTLWSFLILITLGLASYYVIPYMFMSNFCLYKNLSKSSN